MKLIVNTEMLNESCINSRCALLRLFHLQGLITTTALFVVLRTTTQLKVSQGWYFKVFSVFPATRTLHLSISD